MLGEEETNPIRERSGSVKSKSKLVAFLYLIMRDCVKVSDIEEAVQQIDLMTAGKARVYQFSNGWLAEYAKDLAQRLGEVERT